MKNALNNQVGMLGDMFLWLVANLKQGVIYFIKQALPPNISAGSVKCKFKSICTFVNYWINVSNCKYNRLELHRKINDLLKEEFLKGLHALEINII